jgi:hypothetical protein
MMAVGPGLVRFRDADGVVDAPAFASALMDDQPRLRPVWRDRRLVETPKAWVPGAMTA